GQGDAGVDQLSFQCDQIFQWQYLYRGGDQCQRGGGDGGGHRSGEGHPEGRVAVYFQQVFSSGEDAESRGFGGRVVFEPADRGGAPWAYLGGECGGEGVDLLFFVADMSGAAAPEGGGGLSSTLSAWSVKSVKYLSVLLVGVFL